MAGRQECGDDAAAFFAHHVAVRPRYFSDQTMGSEQADFAGDGAGTPLLFPFGSFGGKEQRAQIPVAKATRGSLSRILPALLDLSVFS